MKALSTLGFVFLLASVSCQRQTSKLPDAPRRIEILFLGHASDHHPSARHVSLLTAALTKEGINFTYTEDPADLNPETLSWFDGVMLYANHEAIAPEQERALLDFVAAGKGFIPVHSASFCFQNSEAYIELVGGQFQRHDTGTFVANIVAPDHPAMASVDTFSTWDETYVHHQLTDDRTVLMERVEGEHREPWTWVREHGEGRVFYTAYGHDERTWRHPEFHRLLRQGILWAVGDRVKSWWEQYSARIPELRYRDEDNIPNYEQRTPPPRYQEPLSPEESARLIQVPPGFDLELFAAEPDIVNPISMNWDEKGRLWVIETVDYPNTVREAEGGDDRIKICEDTDGDGRADKFTIFADSLNIPTGFVFVNGGVMVAQAPVFLFLRDLDGDDRADEREVIMDGWGTFDTHAGPSNLQYGFDNNVWGVVGYSGFKGTIAGESRSFNQGLYRFHPDLSQFEFLSATSNNTWGLGFTEDNNVFASTANNTHSLFLGITDAEFAGVEGIPVGSARIDGHYAMRPVTDKVRQVDVFGGFTAASGHHFYNARTFPAPWRDAAFVCEPTGHLVHVARIERDGAGFVERDGGNLFASADEWVAPVEAKTGPDGAVWILDWYNFIVQHNPTPTAERGGYAAENGPGNAYVNPLRDREHGRIWRVVWRDAEPRTTPQLDHNEPADLVRALSDDNHFWRMTAQRLLVERGNTDVVPSLISLATETDVDADGHHYPAGHALWTLHGLGAVTPGSQGYNATVGALQHPAPEVRKAAIRVLVQAGGVDAVVESGVLNDGHPDTRLAAILALCRASPSSALGARLYALSRDETIASDNWLARAVYVAAVRHREGFLAAFQTDHPDYTPVSRERRREMPDYDDSRWKRVTLPATFEEAGFDIDGVVWFRTTVTLPANQGGQKGVLSLGPIDESDETWINGVKVGDMKGKYATPRIYDLPPGLLRAGENVIAVRVEDTGSRGGFYGTPDRLFLQTGGYRASLAKGWTFEIEKRYDAGMQPIFENTSLAEVFAANYFTSDIQPEQPAVKATVDATEISLRAVVNEMKYDLTQFTVEAGKPVRITFENPDFMQHNVVIVKPGTMRAVGAAADRLAADPEGSARQYIPDMPEVLFHTPLVNPGQTVTLEFVAPDRPGDYPFVCTFPGHWSIMNGTMQVVENRNPL